MSLLTVAEVRQEIETDLSDEAIQRNIDEQEQCLDRQIGKYDIQTDEIENDEPLPDILFLSRKAKSITTVIERVNDTDTILAADDYRLKYNNTCLERLNTGTNARTYWGNYVKIIYTPESDVNIRKGVIIDLLKLKLAFNGQKREEIGDYKTEALEYEQQRKIIINRLKGWSL